MNAAQEGTGTFSVVIPTLQRSGELEAVVSRCCAHRLVDEVILINNAEQPVELSHEKLRVLNQDRNIYVNPAWNLGVAEATSDFVAILNDDVVFEDEAFEESARVLAKGRFAMVGPDSSCFLEHEADRAIGHRIASSLRFRYGTFMCMRRRDYVPIPDELLIWGGDDWLFWGQRKPNAVLVHTRFRTSMGTTSGSAEFQQLRAKEQALADKWFLTLHHHRWWHRPVELLERIRLRRAALTNRLRRSKGTAQR